MSFIFIYSSSISQDSTFSITKTIVVSHQISEIIDFKIDDSKMLFLKEDTLIVIDRKKNTKEVKSAKKINGIEINRSKIRTMSSISNTEVFSGDSKVLETKAKFIASTGNGYYTCKISGDSVNYSMDNQIVFVDSEGNDNFFAFVKGFPAGLAFFENKLYYLSNRSKANTKGILYVYDTKTSRRVSHCEIPVVEPIGLDIQAGEAIHTFSRKQNSVIQFKRIRK